MQVNKTQRKRKKNYLNKYHGHDYYYYSITTTWVDEKEKRKSEWDRENQGRGQNEDFYWERHFVDLVVRDSR